MLLPMPAVTRWGHGAGVAGARAVRRCRWDGRIRAPCVIRGVSAAKRAPPWQDLRAMHSRKAIAGLFGYMARISCQTQLVLDAWRRYVAREGCFSRPGPLRGCMKRKNCHGLPPGNAPRRNLATDCRPGTHRGEILPPPVTRERISRRSCHGRTPGFASRRITIALPQNNAKGRIRGTPPPRQKKASVLLAFFRCLVLRLEWPGPSK